MKSLKNSIKNKKLTFNSRIKMSGLPFLKSLPDNKAAVCFFDPQYRGILDKMKYGNEGKNRGKERSSLSQMSESLIKKFIKEIHRVLKPSAHLFLWIDKFHLCSGFTSWVEGEDLEVVDMITWDKGRMGMGYRSRRQSEHLIILQKKPKRAKGVWKIHNIPDVWKEEVKKHDHTHSKPIELQAQLILAVTNKKDLVIDPASGSFSVLKACELTGRDFLGCDING